MRPHGIGRIPRARQDSSLSTNTPKRTEEGGDTLSPPVAVRENRRVGGVKGPSLAYAGRGSRVCSPMCLGKRTEEGGDKLSAPLTVRESPSALALPRRGCSWEQPWARYAPPDSEMVDRSDVARLLLLDGQGLLDDPDRPATPKWLLAGIEAMGFVQVDSIVTVARAHHLTLAARFSRYRPETLRRLLEDQRLLFE